MARYTKKDSEGRYYIESANGKLESNIKGYTYGEAIDRLAEFETADVVPKSEVERIFEEIDLIHKKVFVDVAKMSLGDLEKTVLYEYFKLIGGCTNTLKKKYTESEGKG